MSFTHRPSLNMKSCRLLLRLCEVCSRDCLSMFQMSVLCMYGSTLETAHEEIQKKQPPTYSLVVTPPSRLYETICIHLPGLRISGVHLQTVQHYGTQWQYHTNRTCSKCPCFFFLLLFSFFCRVSNWLQVDGYRWRRPIAVIILLVTAYLSVSCEMDKTLRTFFCDRGCVLIQACLGSDRKVLTILCLMVVTLWHCVSWLCSFSD